TAPTSGKVLTLISNDGTDPVVVTSPFVTPANVPLPEGSTVTVGTFAAVLSYHGGDGNDVTLSTAPPVFTSAGSATITAGAFAAFTVTASGTPAPTITLNPADVLPSGVTFTAGTL